MLGKHILANFINCQNITDGPGLTELLRGAAERANATVIQVIPNNINTVTFGCVVVISESHLSAFVKKTRRFVALDIFTCGDQAVPEEALEYLIEKLRPGSVEKTVFMRGYE